MKKLTLISSLLAVLAIAGCNDSVPYGACNGQMAVMDNGQLKICVVNSWSEDTTCTEDGATMCGDHFIAKCTENKWQVSTECESFEVCKDVSGTPTCVESTDCDVSKDVPACNGLYELKTCVDGKWTSTSCDHGSMCQGPDAATPVASCVAIIPPSGCDTEETTCENSTLRYCEANEWKTKTCENGCEGTKCKETTTPETCNAADYPKCSDDGKLLTCPNGTVETTACTEGKTCKTTESGASCEAGDTEIKECTESCDHGCNTHTGTCYVECNPAEYTSSCSDNTLTFCNETGEITESNCNDGNKVCKDEGNGAECVTDDKPPVTEHDCDEEGKSICDGNSVKTCEGGEWEVRPCVEECKEDVPGDATCSELEVGTECTEGDAQCDGSFKIIKCVNGHWAESTDCGYQQTCQKINDVTQCSNACRKGRGICNNEINATYICDNDTLTWVMTPCEDKRCAVSEKMSKCIIRGGDACSLYSFNKDDDPVEKALCDFDRMFVCQEEVLTDKQPFCGSGKDDKAIKLCADDIPIYRPCYEYAWISPSCNLGNLSQTMTKQDFNTGNSEALSRASEDEINDKVYLDAKDALTESSACEVNECKIHYYTINTENCNETIEGQDEPGCYTYSYNSSNNTATKTEKYYLQTSELKFIAGPVIETKVNEESISLRAIYTINSKEIVYSWIKADALSEQSCGQVVTVD